MIQVHEQAFDNHHRDDHQITMRVMMQKTVFIVFLDGFHFSAGWSSSPARCCSACGNTRSWGRSTGSQVSLLWEIHPGVKILTWILSRVEGGGLCDENRCCSKCSAELSDASQLNPQQADGKPGRNKVGRRQKKRVKDDTNSIKVDLVIMVPHSRYEDRTLARGGQQQQNNSHATNGAAAYSVEMPTITNCSNQRNMFFFSFNIFSFSRRIQFQWSLCHFTLAPVEEEQLLGPQSILLASTW